MTAKKLPQKIATKPAITEKQKKFIKQIEEKVKKTITKYKLIKDKKEKILVAVSGGKDSTSLLYMLHKFGYNVEALTIDVLIGNYTKENLANIKKFCSDIGVKLHVVTFRKKFGYSVCYMRSVLNKKGLNLRSCTICGVLRRYLINKNAGGFKAVKVATGHNMDDEAQSFMMNLIRNKMELTARLGPMPGLVRDKRFVPRIKPLYLISEEEVKKYSQLMNFPVNYSPCPCRVDAFRNRVRQYLDKLEEEYPQQNIKENLILKLLDNLPELKKKYASNQPVKVCEKCGEPTKSVKCRTCQILEEMS